MLNSNLPTKKYDYCGACTFYLGAIIIVLICQALAGIVSAGLSRIYPNVALSGDFNTAYMIIVQLASAAFIAIYTKLNRYKLNFSPFKRGGTGKIFLPSTFVVPIAAAILLMIAMYLPTLWYGYFTHFALGVSAELGNIELSTTSSVVMLVIASVFLAPVCEEAIYRGVLLNGLRKERFAIKAVMLSALAFMLMHMSPVQVVFQFSLGVVSAFIMIKSTRLLPSALFHAVANALALIIQLTPLGNVLVGCELWLIENVAAALFITLGLFVGGGAALFVLVKFGFDTDKLFANNSESDNQAVSDGYVDGAENAVTDEARAETRRKDGTFRYWIGIAICAVLFVINLIVSVV